MKKGDTFIITQEILNRKAKSKYNNINGLEVGDIATIISVKDKGYSFFINKNPFNYFILKNLIKTYNPLFIKLK